jgi:hypothetical protein
MRRFVALCAVVTALGVVSSRPAAAAKKPKLPAACVEALQKGEAMAVVLLETGRSGARLSLATEPFVRGTAIGLASTNPQGYVDALGKASSAYQDLSAILESGDAARDAYARAVEECQRRTR